MSAARGGSSGLRRYELGALVRKVPTPNCGAEFRICRDFEGSQCLGAIGDLWEVLLGNYLFHIATPAKEETPVTAPPQSAGMEISFGAFSDFHQFLAGLYDNDNRATYVLYEELGRVFVAKMVKEYWIDEIVAWGHWDTVTTKVTDSLRKQKRDAVLSKFETVYQFLAYAYKTWMHYIVEHGDRESADEDLDALYQRYETKSKLDDAMAKGLDNIDNDMAEKAVAAVFTALDRYQNREHAAIFRARLEGHSYSKLAGEFRVTMANARKIVERMMAWACELEEIQQVRAAALQASNK